ncbi:unnamed protein product [Caenorhabditis bovis]|uniref:Uncharacterized protein n=1 Tax=Caenorhabditis bovis TaxID=2654633 RepID=A0A8S1ERZ1_9PELO|nr:unnamed protein product [Caenorhabditis bovis]
MKHELLICRTYRMFESYETMCCCEFPHCNKYIIEAANNELRDAHLSANMATSCVVGHYSSDDNWKFVQSTELFPVCSLRFIVIPLLDSRSGRIHNQVNVSFEVGCGFDMTDEPLVIHTTNTSVEYCCRGVRCNRDIFMVFGVEFIINTVFAEHERGLCAFHLIFFSF